MSSSNSQLKIAIIGAGLGGLTLARTLQQNYINCSVFELDASPNSRPQGGSLDIHQESGQHALRTNGLWDKIEPHVRYEGEDLRIADKTGKIWLEEINEIDDPSYQGNRPEVDRGVLRQIYIDSIKEGTIHWGTQVKNIIPVEPLTENGRTLYTLVFRNGTEETFDIVVGADGAWSRVRALLSDAKPVYGGVIMIETRLMNVDEDYPEEAKLVGHGTMCALSDNKGIMVQRNGDGSIRNYVTLRIPENGLPEKEFLQESTGRAYLLNQFNDWCQDLRNLIENGQGLTPRPINALPIEHRWTSRPGITIIGDAAHLMSPFAGEGANLAMIDGLELGLVIVKVIKEGGDLAVCQQEFEKAMIDRSQQAAAMSAQNMKDFISADAPRRAVAFFQGHSQCEH
ncbi:hypothetical protein BGZ80_003137 [Entomortierella chlamydospora]|uniref:FAD-binding domain-containing protein n=1 Tax=Entomortierella chlamydospora TaxID=101097 RepID=A0A9P6MPE2_9FUNG|nr:hypothetical protein BGZ79_005443 [Entomortierella chlamydospora]KAG0008714.1 hypothetical protein BGZ80_003137 [Entomortierella chlamydospora]